MNSKNIIILVFSLFWLNSCSYKDDKLRKNIIGTYYTVQNIEDENFLVSGDSYDTYSEDGTYLSIGKIQVLTTDEDLGSVNLKYTLSVMGKYRIENSKLLVDYDLNTFSIIYEGTDNVIIDFELIMYFQQFRKQLENIIISNLKEGMNKTDVYKIIELTSDKMVTVDSEGNKISSKRVEKVEINNLSYKENLNKTENPITNEAEPNSLNKYCNDRFEFCIEYPKSFEGQGESNNGDGQIFISQDNQSKITVYGQLCVDNNNLDYYYNSVISDINVTYKTIKNNNYIYSGKNAKGEIVYGKIVKKTIDNYQGEGSTDAILNFMIEYPESQINSYTSYCKTISKSFQN